MMGKKQSLKQRRKNERRIAYLKRYLGVALIVAVFLSSVSIGWRVFKPDRKVELVSSAVLEVQAGSQGEKSGTATAIDQSADNADDGTEQSDSTAGADDSAADGDAAADGSETPDGNAAAGETAVADGTAADGSSTASGDGAAVDSGSAQSGSGDTAGLQQTAATTHADQQATTREVKNKKPSSYQIPGWQADDTGYWYETAEKTYYASGWMTLDGKEYYFDENGYMATGWISIAGRSCYFGSDGVYQPQAKKKMIAMTFDDGPNQYTDHLLDILAQNNAKATFFMVGTQAEQFPDTIKKMASLGMELGNHTWDHTYLTKSDPQTMYGKFAQTDQLLKEITGQESTVFRSPGGIESDEYRAGISKPLILWAVDTLDWKNKDVAMNIDAVIGKVSDGDIVLMHDFYETTVTSCETIIPELISEGYQLVTVSELAAANGVTLEPGEDYFNLCNPDEEVDLDENNLPLRENTSL